MKGIVRPQTEDKSISYRLSPRMGLSETAAIDHKQHQSVADNERRSDSIPNAPPPPPPDDSPEVVHALAELLSGELALRLRAELPDDDEHEPALRVQLKILQQAHHAVHCDLLRLVRVCGRVQIQLAGFKG